MDRLKKRGYTSVIRLTGDSVADILNESRNSGTLKVQKLPGLRFSDSPARKTEVAVNLENPFLLSGSPRSYLDLQEQVTDYSHQINSAIPGAEVINGSAAEALGACKELILLGHGNFLAKLGENWISTSTPLDDLGLEVEAAADIDFTDINAGLEEREKRLLALAKEGRFDPKIIILFKVGDTIALGYEKSEKKLPHLVALPLIVPKRSNTLP